MHAEPSPFCPLQEAGLTTDTGLGILITEMRLLKMTLRNRRLQLLENDRKVLGLTLGFTYYGENQMSQSGAPRVVSVGPASSHGGPVTCAPQDLGLGVWAQKTVG